MAASRDSAAHPVHTAAASMFTVRTPHRLLQLPIFLVVALVLACGEDTLEIPVALTCADLVIVDVEGGQRGPLVVPVGGSLVIRVGLRELTRDYEFCSEISLQRFRWEIADPGLARVENSVERGRPLRHGDPRLTPVATITGLAVGQTSLTLFHDLEPQRWALLEVVEP